MAIVVVLGKKLPLVSAKAVEIAPTIQNSALLIVQPKITIKTPKRLPQGKCSDCKKTIRSQRKYCPECLQSNHRMFWPSLTLQELYQKGSRNVYHICVRQHSKQVAEKAGLLRECKICGYSFYVECCHIKPVSSFPKSTTLAVVNAESNLIGLCPNHHKELDRGNLKL